MFCKQLSLRGIECSWLGSHWKTFVSMRVLPCAWSPAFFLWWETVRIKRLLPAVWKCFKSLRASAWACSLGRLGSAAGEGEWRWQVIRAVQVEGSRGKKKQALLLHHCLYASRWKQVSSPTWPAHGCLLWFFAVGKPLLNNKKCGRVEKIWWKQEKGGSCKHGMCILSNVTHYTCILSVYWEVGIYLCCFRLSIMPEFMLQLPFIFCFPNLIEEHEILSFSIWRYYPKKNKKLSSKSAKMSIKFSCWPCLI